VRPLQSVNYHDSHVHSHEWYGPFTRLVGVWLVWIGLGWVYFCLVGLIRGMQQVRSLCAWFLVLAIGVRPVSSVQFCYRGETCELCSVLATGVRPVSW
jgi:hypothetical protein